MGSLRPGRKSAPVALTQEAEEETDMSGPDLVPERSSAATACRRIASMAALGNPERLPLDDMGGTAPAIGFWSLGTLIVDGARRLTRATGSSLGAVRGGTVGSDGLDR